ncbi:MAG: SRPBCC family protein [Actinomycetota bacterium]
MDVERPMQVEREVVLPVSPHVAWEAITDDAELSEWFAADAALDPRPGGSGRFVDDDGTVRHAVVEAVEPERHLRFVWWPEGGTSGPTSVDFELVEVGAGTRLTVIEAPAPSTAWPATLARLQGRCSLVGV